eukprot:TRINITY_DN56025_c0_g1_i1.p1 TRINITY_DN56025_c0_g1~~TRINITY_DN56025_c0_g1_i1.p1  ORF type:complete len:402 (-),score=72.26 TRINITY_DN56025_c0_g1_i1:33-1238(-)
MKKKPGAKRKAQPAISDKDLIEVEKMDQRLRELREAVAKDRENSKRSSTGSIWSSASRGTTGTAKKAAPKKTTTTTTTTATTTPRNNTTSGVETLAIGKTSTTTGTGPNVPMTRATSSSSTGSGPAVPTKTTAKTTSSTTTTTGTDPGLPGVPSTGTTPRTTTTTSTTGTGPNVATTPTGPAPPKTPPQRNIRFGTKEAQPKPAAVPVPSNFSMFNGSFDQGAKMTDSEAHTIRYMQQAKERHDEHFQEIDQFTYDEEQEHEEYYARVREELKLKNEAPPPHLRPTSTGRSRRPMSATSTADSQVETIELEPVTGTGHEIATSPIAQTQPKSFLASTTTSTTTTMQTGTDSQPLTNPIGWEPFVAALKEATQCSYWDHLLNQLTLVEKMKQIQALQAEGEE